VKREATLDLQRENEELRARLAESEEVLRAVRSGEVDAMLGSGERGGRILTLGQAESAHRALVEAMNEGAAILIGPGTVLYCNGRLAAMLNAPLERVMGASLFGFIAPADREAVAALIARSAEAGCCVDTTFCRADGTLGPVQLSLSPMSSEGPPTEGPPTISVVATDLTARNLAREELRNLSLVDDLTGLSNRRGFLTLAQQQLATARRLEIEALLVFADMDGFKAINDTQGHRSGDEALREVAEVLRATYRESDIVARLGGDEFAVFAMCAPGRDTEILATRLQDNLDACNSGADRGYRLAMSVGMVRCGDGPAATIGDLLAQADAAMYEQKRARRRSGQKAPGIDSRLAEEVAA